MTSMLEYIKQNCILRAKDGYKLFDRAGGKFIWSLDLRRLLIHPQYLSEIAETFLENHQNFDGFQVAGVETSGIPIMSAIMMAAKAKGIDVNGVIVRTKRKKHLQQQLIDGMDNGKPVIIVDDSMNSGSSVANTATKLRDAGYNVSHAFVILNFESQNGVKNLVKNKILVMSMFGLDDIGLELPHKHQPVTQYNVAWTFASPNPDLRYGVCKSTPVIYKESIIFGTDAGIVWCLETKTGRIKWWFNTNDKSGRGIWSTPIVVDDKLYIGGYNGYFYCFNPDNGAVIWSTKKCDWIGSSPCYGNGRVYVGLEFRSKENKGSLGCFDALTGQLYWEYPTKVQLHGSPTYSEEHKAIVLGTNDGTVVVLDAETGEKRQEITGLKAVKYSATLKGDLAVFGAFDGGIYVWDFVKNEVKFKYQTDDLVYSKALIVGDRAYMGSSDHQFVVIDLARMQLVSAFDVGEKVHSSPSLIGNLVYFGTSKGELFGMDPETLNIMVRLQFPERLTNAVVTDGNLIFVHAFDNKIWAIRYD